MYNNSEKIHRTLYQIIIYTIACQLSVPETLTVDDLLNSQQVTSLVVGGAVGEVVLPADAGGLLVLHGLEPGTRGDAVTKATTVGAALVPAGAIKGAHRVIAPA